MKRLLLLLTAVLSAAGQSATPGLEPGATIPAFSLTDQDGKQQSFATIAGPKGAMLVFFRSADW